MATQDERERIVSILVEVAGWIGAVLILLAYLLVTMGRLTGKSAAFQWMNLVGAAGFTINGWWHRAIPSAALNVIWMLIAAVALGRIWKTTGSSTSAT
jgi:cell shape-determining protein MreD